jgi:hypothetical protein
LIINARLELGKQPGKQKEKAHPTEEERGRWNLQGLKEGLV